MFKIWHASVLVIGVFTMAPIDYFIASNVLLLPPFAACPFDLASIVHIKRMRDMHGLRLDCLLTIYYLGVGIED